MIKISFCCICLLLILSLSHAQDLSSYSNFQRWFKENKYKGLKVGDRMPDISLGKVVNNKTGEAKFSDFKGKLVILDFWGTSCSSCIAAFPKMEKLQQEFGDQIQIFIVNSFETEEEIKQRMSAPHNKNKKLPDLPSIVDAKQLLVLFPHREVPHHVWIDGDGIVRLIGRPENTNPEKIKDVLAGEKIRFVKGRNLTEDFDPAIPYAQKLKGKPEYQVNQNGYSSFFSRFDNDYGNAIGNNVKNMVDTLERVRNTYLNMEIWELYFDLFKGKLVVNMPLIFYSKAMPFLILTVSDTLKYTSNYSDWLKRTDKYYFENRFCYEQVCPVGYSEEERRDAMLRDLNTYFGSLYGTIGNLEKRLTPIYILKKSTKNNIAKSHHVINKDADEQYKKIKGVRQGKKTIHYIGWSIGGAMSDMLLDSTLQKLLIKELGHSFLFLDETGSKEMLDLTLPDPQTITSIDALRRVLMPYGFDIIKQNRELDYLVIKENSNKVAHQ